MAGLFDDIISRQIGLERTKAGESRRLRGIIKKLDKQIDIRIRNLPEKYTKAQLDKLIRDIRKITLEFYDDKVVKFHEDIASGVVTTETRFAYNMVDRYLATEAVNRPLINDVLKAGFALNFQDKPLPEWSSSLGVDKANKIAREMRMLGAENAEVATIVSGVSSKIRVANNNADTVTKAYVSHFTNISRETVYEENPESVDEIVWSSILDGRTTVTCGVRSNKRYNAQTKEPIDHDNSWNGGPGNIHWGCRSVGIPINKSGVIVSGSGAGEQYDEGTRTAIGAEDGYERGGNLKSNGKAAKIPTQNNQLEKELVPASLDYETWLRRQPRPFIEDVLGKGKAEEFINNKVSLQSFVVEDGTELTLDEITKKVA